MKSPHNALQMFEHWVHHVCLQIMSLVMHGHSRVLRKVYFVITYISSISQSYYVFVFNLVIRLFFCLFVSLLDKIPTAVFSSQYRDGTFLQVVKGKKNQNNVMSDQNFFVWPKWCPSQTNVLSRKKLFAALMLREIFKIIW